MEPLRKKLLPDFVGQTVDCARTLAPMRGRRPQAIEIKRDLGDCRMAKTRRGLPGRALRFLAISTDLLGHIVNLSKIEVLGVALPPHR
jgi:hypothetical protein